MDPGSRFACPGRRGWIQFSNSLPLQPALSAPPSPREAAGSRRAKLALRGRGWGVPRQTRCQRSKPTDPPPPTSRASFARLGPHHARCTWREGSAPCTASRSRRMFLREVFIYFPPSRREGAGNAGRPMRPIAACAMVETNAHALVRSHRKSPGIPRAMVLTVSFVLSPVTGFLATVASWILPRA